MFTVLGGMKKRSINVYSTQKYEKRSINVYSTQKYEKGLFMFTVLRSSTG